MLLRASGQINGDVLDVHTLRDGSRAAASGIPHAEALVAFAEAVVKMEDEGLAKARARLVDELGSAALVDAAAIASNFERMVRIADSTGIPLDQEVRDLTPELRESLDLNEFSGARNTP